MVPNGAWGKRIVESLKAAGAVNSACMNGHKPSELLAAIEDSSNADELNLSLCRASDYLMKKKLFR